VQPGEAMLITARLSKDAQIATAACRSMSKSSLALTNLRAFVILLVIAFHSVLAYLGSQPTSPPQFDSPPYWWRAIPIIDPARWFGFDLFSALTYLYLIFFPVFSFGRVFCARDRGYFSVTAFCASACRSYSGCCC
jgi:hypothetical protein